jgi:hypothetical protein
MPDNRKENGVREQLLDLLLRKVDEDTYPSETMMDLIEQLVTPEDKPAYAKVLMSKIESETYPSNSMISRVLALG